MMAVPARIVLALLLSLHAIVAWGASRADALAMPLGEVAHAGTVRVDPCGPVCCCGPEHCPCAIDVPAPRSGTPDPGTLPQRPEVQGVRAATSTPPATPPFDDDIRLASSRFVLTPRPAGELGRRLMQLQCVWRT